MNPRKRHMAVEPVLTTPELCERWHTSKWTIRREMAAKRLRGFKVGGTFRFRLDEVERYERVSERRAA